MKTIKERAKAYADNYVVGDFAIIVDLIHKVAEESYIAGATEQKAIDRNEFKEYLEKKRGIFLSRAMELYDSTDTMASAYNNARLKLLDEIINELFKED